MKKLVAVCLISIFIFFSLYAAGGDIRYINRLVATVSNVSGLGTDVVDVTSVTLSDTLGLYGQQVYNVCLASLRITSLTGTAPSAVIKIDQSYNLNNSYENNATTFTACTAACNETKMLLFGTVSVGSIPANMRIKHTTSGTSVTDLDYEIYLTCQMAS